ncbi:hypothetical protein K439DRAFT_1641825 [Ramaria rubella]|nr:hypothetical protein K439DRAFT_1641825 [Ramaria rubella]
MGFTAVITGASGITGGALVEYLSHNPSTWSTIHAISRSQKQCYPKNVKHHSIDLVNTSPDEIARTLQNEGILADYVFFAAYKEDPDEQKMCDLNGRMIDSFLKALQRSQENHPIRRIVLTTGAKYYGVHLGHVRLPCVESDPRVDLGPNFYYIQEDILEKRCKESGWKWNVCRPNDVLGSVKGNFMNLAVTLALYASVQKELREPLWFPGNERFYCGWDDQTYAPLLANFEEWVALQPHTANEAFNIANDDKATWSRLWPSFSKYFGVPIPKDHFGAPPPLPHRVDQPGPSPLAKIAQEIGISPVPDGFVDSRLSLVRWSKLPQVQKAWNSLAERHGLDPDALKFATWKFADFVLSRSWDVVLSMSKARSYGWTGFKDTTTAYADVFKKLERDGVIPPMSKLNGV